LHSDIIITQNRMSLYNPLHKLWLMFACKAKPAQALKWLHGHTM